MTPRERVLTALSYRAPDRVPLFYRDVEEVEQRLLRELQLADSEALLQYLGMDFRWVGPAYIGPPLVNEATGRRRDIWGIEYQFIHFNEHAGYLEPVTHPLAGCDDPAALDDYPWPQLEWFDFSGLRAQISRYDDYAIMTAPGYASPGVFQYPLHGLLGMEQCLMDIYLNPDFIHALIDRVYGFLLPFVDRMLEAAGDRIDFFRVGDDFGTQKGLLVGPAQWREFVQPGLKALSEITRRHGGHFYLHSCGAIRELIPDIIDAGVEVLDPVQVRATGMEPRGLAADFGGRICFCGGVDEQVLLRTGTPAEVKANVRELLDTMARDGGFFIGPTHNFQDDIPTENIVALYQAAREWRG